VAKKYKIIVPKPASCNEHGTEVRLYKADEIVESEGQWQDDVMSQFIENGWAMEVKVDSPEESVEVEAEISEEAPKRARNKKGQLVGDDPDTPDVNEAWEGGKAPAKKTAKKSTKKKSTKKTS
tara:strand:- start:283 stop:651 length:369 start_codon:yes stop_codon:yes gene_type:complete